MKKEIIAIIGLGYWGTIVTNTLVSMNRFKKIYVYDKDKGKIQNITKKFNNKVNICSLKDLINNNEIKNIFLATPPRVNFKLLKSLIKKKKIF